MRFAIAVCKRKDTNIFRQKKRGEKKEIFSKKIILYVDAE
jgi:hypothetical protein